MPDIATPTPGARPRHRSPIRRVGVERVERLTPGLVRVSFTGEALDGFAPPRPAAHVKLHMQPQGVAWDPLDETAPRPPRRTYTPRCFDAAARRLHVDFVLHGSGLASDWAARAEPGQTLYVSGPGGGYDVPADATTLILVADDTALPAVGTILDAMPATCQPIVHAEIAGPAEQRTLSDVRAAVPRWYHREAGRAPPGALLEAAVRGMAAPAGAHWWIACEASAMRRIKQHLLRDKQIDPARLHTRGYWKTGQAEYPDHDYGKD